MVISKQASTVTKNASSPCSRRFRHAKRENRNDSLQVLAFHQPTTVDEKPQLKKPLFRRIVV